MQLKIFNGYIENKAKEKFNEFKSQKNTFNFILYTKQNLNQWS